MKIFIAHKFRGTNKKKLKEKIERIANLLEKKGYKTFNYFRDVEKWEQKNFPPGKVIEDTFNELRKCDAFLAFIDSKEKSEGLLLEFGFSKALKKKTILLISSKVSSPTLEAIADKVIKFRSWEELNEKLKNLKIEQKGF